MHIAHDQQLGQLVVADLTVHQRMRNNATDLPAGLKHGVGDDAHQPDMTPAINQSESTHCHLLPQRACRRRVHWIVALR